MIHITEAPQNMTVLMPITQEALQTAHHFASQFSTQQKAEQIYFNTLAVYAVNNYLRIMGISTELTTGDSWNPVVRLVNDVADLWIPNKGRLECRPVQSDSSNSSQNSQSKNFPASLFEKRSVSTPRSCFVPPESQEERMGYVVVQINLEQQEATLLGFTQTVITNEILIQDLQPIDELLKELYDETITAPFVQLSQWWQNIFEVGWQPIEAFLDAQMAAQSFNQVAFRRDTRKSIRRAKPLSLGQDPSQIRVTFVVNLSQREDKNFDIWLQIFPQENEDFLPEGLRLNILDGSGETFFEISSKQNDRLLQTRQFTGQLEEHFQVQVSLGKNKITENFVI